VIKKQNMIKKLFFFILFIPISGFAQFNMGVKLGANLPIEYEDNVTYRNFGSELNINFGNKFNNKWGMEYGLMIDAHGALDKAYPEVENTEYLRLQFYIPLIVSYSINEIPIKLKAGFMIAYKNALTFTRYSGMDPSNLEGKYPTYPESKGLGCDFTIEIDYSICKRFSAYLAYRTPIINTRSKYGIITLGLHYNFYNNKK
jgi:hypothetical protein